MEDKFKLPSSSYEQLAKIIQGYASLNKPASLDDVSKRVGINPTVISGNNAFLVSVGVLEGGRNKASTLLGKRLGDALSHDLELEAQVLWREIIDGSDFLKNLIGAIRIRRGMDESALKAHIAYTAGAARSPGVTTGSGAILDLLKRAAVVEERDGKFVATSPLSQAASETAEIASESDRSPVLAQAAPTMTYSVAAGAVSIRVEIRVDCKPEDLDGLGARLRRLTQEVSGDAAASPDQTEK